MNPKDLAEIGERIYSEKYKAAFEIEHPGKFVAIEVLSGKAFIDEQPEVALQKARKDFPTGLFHLVRVGSPGAFRVSYISNARSDWLFR